MLEMKSMNKMKLNIERERERVLWKSAENVVELQEMLPNNSK
jgi:hypothetical protein